MTPEDSSSISARDPKIYWEMVPWPFWFHVLLGSVGAFTFWAAIEGFSDPGPSWLVPLLFLVAVSIFFVWYTFRYLEVEVGPDGVGFGFGRIRKRVPRERILSLEVERYSVAKYMGWGYRIGWGTRDRAYSVIGRRRGLRLHFKDERGREWRIFLSCTDPEAAVAAYESNEVRPETV